MRDISTALRDHVRSGAATLADILTITREDGTVIRSTNHNRDIVYDGNTYSAAKGFRRSSITHGTKMKVPSCDVTLLVGDITPGDVAAGLFDGAEISIDFVNFRDLTMGHGNLITGVTGDAKQADVGKIEIEVRGTTQKLRERHGEKFQITCDANLGDERCQVPVWPKADNTGHLQFIARETAYTAGQYVMVETDGAADGSAKYENRIYECTVSGTTASSEPTFNTTIDATTVDGTASFAARNSFTRTATVSATSTQADFYLTIDEARLTANWFVGGVLTFETGANAGRSTEVSKYNVSGDRVYVYTPFRKAIEVGDVLRITPGCNFTNRTCRTKWVIENSLDFADRGNVRRFRGMREMPSQLQISSYPNSR